MAFFTVEFERTESITIVLKAKDRWEAEKAARDQCREGFFGWEIDSGLWEESVSGPCKPDWDLNKSDLELCGIDKGTDPADQEARWIIVGITDAPPEPEESEEDRKLREFREAEEAGQLALSICGGDHVD